MELMDFFEKVEAHADLVGLGVDGPECETPAVLVQHASSKLKTRVPVEVIEASEWEALQDVLIGERDPYALQHMTRVVGYFSRVENWNKSKIGELKDRHRGDYAVANAASANA